MMQLRSVGEKMSQVLAEYIKKDFKVELLTIDKSNIYISCSYSNIKTATIYFENP